MKTKTINLKCPRCSRRIPVSVSNETQRLSCSNCDLAFDLRFGDGTPLMRVLSSDMDSDPASSPHADSTTSRASGSGDHQYIRVKQWREKRGAILSPMEEKLHVLGLLFAVIGIACAVFPWFAVPLGMGTKPLFLIGMWGLISMAISAVFLLYTLRHQPPRSLISVGLLILIGGGLNGWTAQRFYGEVVASRIGEEQSVREDPAVTSGEGRPIQVDPMANPAASYVPPRLRDPAATSQNPPNRFFEVDNPTQADPATPGQASTPSPRNDERAEQFRPDLARDRINTDELERRTRANPFGENGESPFSVRPTLPSAEFSPHEKRQRIAERASRMLQTRVTRNRAADMSFRDRFAVTRPVGKATVLGRAYYTEMAARGLDAIKSETDPSAIAMVVPFYEHAEFADSLYRSGRYFLAGVNAHFRDGKLVGLQAILAPPKDDRLDLDKAVNSVWFGEAGRGSRVQSITSPQGSPVYGIVVYEEKLKIAGLALIVDREAVKE